MFSWFSLITKSFLERKQKQKEERIRSVGIRNYPTAYSSYSCIVYHLFLEQMASVNVYHDKFLSILSSLESYASQLGHCNATWLREKFNSQSSYLKEVSAKRFRLIDPNHIEDFYDNLHGI